MMYRVAIIDDETGPNRSMMLSRTRGDRHARFHDADRLALGSPTSRHERADQRNDEKSCW
jgi:hypothetical protein